MRSLTTVEAIFHAALSKASPKERAAFLDGACGNDAELRREVERLLAAQPALGSFLEQSPAPAPQPPQTVDTPVVGEGPGSWIGPYKLLQKLGEGGMGAVFLAEQSEPVRRRLAVKVIKPGLDSAQVLARFEAERQALALMDHPNIARVLDAGGTASGRPYFVMELVKGIPITRYCDQEHLTPRQRLELFGPVCQAVQHAHQKGIIHRDLKPSNVLIALYDGRPVPKVIDFGVAKATAQRLTERTMFTEVGQVVGTLEYMAPEQAELNNLDIDTRADIYSLGVLLYELLAGSPPFTAKQLRSAAFTEMLRIIREVEPPKPSTRLSSSEELPSIAAKRKLEPAWLTKQVQGDLDWIVMKCLEKERGRRYETANGLAMDLGRYLADEPVLASPPSKTYRLRKFLRKHRGSVLAAWLMALLLLIGTVGTAVGFLRAERLRHQAEANEARALEERAGAERWRQQAMEALRAMTDDVVEQVLGAKPALGPSEKAFLANTLKRWQTFAAAQGEGEQARAIRAEGDFRVAFLWSALGQQEEAQTGYRAAIDGWQRLVADFPAAAGYCQELARSLHSMASVLDDLGKRAEAEGAYRDALAFRRKLAADFPAVPAYRQELANSLGNLGNLLSNTGRAKEAEAAYRDSLAVQKPLAADFPTVPVYRRELGSSHTNLGNLLSNTGRPKEAEAAYRDALAIQKPLAADFPTVPVYRQQLGMSHTNLGSLFQDAGRPHEAEAAYRDALAIQKVLAVSFPTVPEYRRDLAASQSNLGNLLKETGRALEAEAAYRDSLAIEQKLAGDFPGVPAYRQALALSFNNLAHLLSETGRPQEAEAAYRDALAIQKPLAADFTTVPAYRQELALSHNNLGRLFWETGRAKEAETSWRDAQAIQQKLAADFPTEPIYRKELAWSLSNLAVLLSEAGRPKEAEATGRDALAIQRRLAADFPTVPAYRQDLALSHANLGIMLKQTDRPKETEAAFCEALAIQQKLAADFPGVPANRQALASSFNNLATFLSETGRSQEAEAAYRDALAIQKPLALDFPNLPDYQIDLAGTLGNLGQLFLDRKDYAEARRLYEQAIPHHQAALKANPHNPDCRKFFRNNQDGLTGALLGLGEHRAAAQSASQFLEAAVHPADDPYDGACYLARCVPLAEKDQRLAGAERKALVQSYADKAMAALRQAVEHGYKDLARMSKDPVLDPLRRRADFQQLLARLEGKAKAAPAAAGGAPPGR